MQSSGLSGNFVASPLYSSTAAGKLDLEFSRGERFVHCLHYVFGTGSFPFDCKFWYTFSYFSFGDIFSHISVYV